MLTHLLIKNYALIQHLEIAPNKGLNVITGETGAGKSIMLGAAGLLLGNRADTKALFDTDAKCIIEGVFNISHYKLKKRFEQEDLDYLSETTIRREISPTGKSRAFINDTPVTLGVLKKIGEKLMEVHSQHETLHLGDHGYQLAFIDAYAGTTTTRHDYKKEYDAWKAATQQLEKLQKENNTIGQEADYNNFLLEELITANLQLGEQEVLESSLNMLEHTEEIKTKLNEVLALASGSEYAAINNLQQAKVLLQQLAKYGKSYAELSERMESAYIEIQDITHELEREEESIIHDPEALQLAQERLSIIYQLQKKHHVGDIGELLTIQETMQEKATRYSNLDEEIASAQAQVASLLEEVSAKANTLSQQRQKVFSSLAGELEELLHEVGMPEAAIRIVHEQTSPGVTGTDRISLHFSANKGIAPQEISGIASGGEFSRLMFCVKYILADKVSLPTIIFDEIDTGISGGIAMKMGTMMQRMAANHQVITISHLPQIAARAEQHYFVYKDSSDTRSISKIKVLSPEERIEEIAKMIAGDTPSDTAFKSARELIDAK